MTTNNLMPKILERFVKKHKNLIEDYGLDVVGIFGDIKTNNSNEINITTSQEIKSDDFNNDDVHISCLIPFIFDHRQLPASFEGVRVICGIIDNTIPAIFSDGINEREPVFFDQYWNPDKFVRFVEGNIDKIKEGLKRPSVTRKEALDAICFGDYNAHVEKCEEILIKRICSC